MKDFFLDIYYVKCKLNFNYKTYNKLMSGKFKPGWMMEKWL